MVPPIDLTLPSSPQSKTSVDLTGSPMSISKQTSNLRTGPRKITIKNLKPTPEAVSRRYYEQTYDKLMACTIAIFREQSLGESLEILYRGVENLVRDGQGDKVYRGLRTVIERYVEDELQKEVLTAVEASAEQNQIVSVVEGAWTKWNAHMNVIRSVFYFLDRAYLLANPVLPSIADLGNNLFRQTIIMNKQLQTPVINGLVELFRQERSGDSASSTLLISAVRLLTTLNLYGSTFETPFLQSTRTFYHHIAIIQFQTQEPTEYLDYFFRQLTAEQRLCQKYLISSTQPKVEAVVVEELGKNVASTIVSRGFEDMLSQYKTSSLDSLYRYCQLSEARSELKTAWAEYVKTHGLKIVMDTDNDATMIPSLLKYKTELDKVLKVAFKDDEQMGFALRENFDAFVNKRQNKPAEMIAKHLDALLRKGQIANEGKAVVSDDGDVNQEMNNVLELFRFIQGKDVFEAFYKKDLAKRLLLNKSASADAERSMLSKLKTECGAGFTQKLEGMFKDVDVSKDFMGSFKNSKLAQENMNADLYVNVLSQAFWPTYPETTVVLPEDMSADLETFRQFYLAKQTGRKLMWRPALGHCVIKADFPHGKKELSVSLFQALILLQFNSTSKPLSYSFLKSATNLDDQELSRTLQSLACGKIRPLLKSPKGRDVATTDNFAINLGFTDKLYRIKINQIQLKETPQENKDTHDRVFMDRQFEIQACIIRIMKSKKQLRHVELIQQVIEHTKMRGTLNMSDIKRQIEKLIEKEYIERDNDIYKYLA